MGTCLNIIYTVQYLKSNLMLKVKISLTLLIMNKNKNIEYIGILLIL